MKRKIKEFAKTKSFQTHADLEAFWSGIRESNPPMQLGKLRDIYAMYVMDIKLRVLINYMIFRP